MIQKQRNLLVGFLLVTVLAVSASLISGHRPQLGLDLKGGVSVVLKPATETTPETLDQAIEIIRNRIDSLGVAEPEISRQGGNILVQIPGVKDRDRAIALVGSTAELRFRPVLKDSCSVNPAAIGNCVPDEGASLESLGINPDATTTTGAPTTTAAGATTTAAAGATTTAAPTTTAAGATTTAAAGATTTAAPTTTAVPATTTTISSNPEERRKQLEELAGINIQTTSRDDDIADAVVVLPERDRKTKELKARYQLGPTGLTGLGISSAEAQAPQIAGSGTGWTVSLDPKEGEEGRDKLNALAAACFSGTEECPTGKLAIVLDGVVQFAGTVQAANFDSSVQLSGNYSKSEAEDITTALKYGSLPIELEQQSVQTVSATLGNDAKNAGIAAGIVGLLFVSIYVLLYYRLLGAVALASLVLSFGLLWAVISYLGETRGLALTLAGITGIIVSIGVSLDSNIVYFEHMKEDIRNGRTPRSASERSFTGAFSTVLKADLASLIGAFTLFFLTSGAVRGFAFYLGLATLLDLIATYFFLGPAVKLVARTAHFGKNPTAYGLPKGPRSTPAVMSTIGVER
jgi:preprotein translocase subunit SecD